MKAFDIDVSACPQAETIVGADVSVRPDLGRHGGLPLLVCFLLIFIPAPAAAGNLRHTPVVKVVQKARPKHQSQRRLSRS